MSASDLQRQCQELLRTLKTNQTSLRQGLGPLTDLSILENNLQGQHANRKPEYARQKMKSIMKQRNGDSCGSSAGNNKSRLVMTSSENGGGQYVELSADRTMPSQDSLWSQEKHAERSRSKERSRLVQGEGQERTNTGYHPQSTTHALSGSNEVTSLKRTRQLQEDSQERYKVSQDGMSVQDKGKENRALPDHDALQEYFQSRTTDSLMEDGTDSITAFISTDDNTRPIPITKSTTPIMVRRRRIIDRNVHVDSEVLSDAELRELEKGTSGLNFSYSQNANETLLKSSEKEPIDHNRNSSSTVAVETMGTDCNQNASSTLVTEELGLEYAKRLVDTGNNRQFSNFVKEATIKPKTILNSTQTFSSRGAPGVSFHSNSSTSSLFRGQAKERRLLGYDWIAALIDNDQGLLDESESYFHELREFRRCNRDECSNDFYMESPFTLTEIEPPEVDKAINETKVQPYTVNERLFTTPVTENLLGEPMEPGRTGTKKEEPTHDDPRFIRVSIPRSTLMLPYKARPHRRRSFDASDSCSLNDHCLLGWSAVRPATLPTASSVALTDALKGTNPKHTTTMAEAERVASTFHWPLLTDPRPQTDSLPTWRKQYLDTTANFPFPDASHSLSSSLGGGPRPGMRRSRTDELLSTTYSMMYEMQRAKEKRGEELRTRKVGEAAS